MPRKLDSNRKAISGEDCHETGYRHVFTMECIDDFLSNLRGEVLTIIDASVTEDRQLKAIKDLVHNRFNGTRWDLINIAVNEAPDAYNDYGIPKGAEIYSVNTEIPAEGKSK